MSKRSQDYETLQKKIGVNFDDINLLKNAFVHRSYHNENEDFTIPSNEKLEFLGDSVLSLITSEYLYITYPQYQEGDYTDMKAAIVNTQSLYEAGKELGLGEYLYLSRGEDENNGRNSISLLADCFEAVLGAVYLEKGYDVSKEFVQKHLFDDTLQEIIDKKLYLPSKNVLQEHYQDKFKKLPSYNIISETGPEHDKTYIVGVFDGDRMLGKGTGKSKKQAEEVAAREALQKLNV